MPASALQSLTAWRTTVSNTGCSSSSAAPDDVEHLAGGRLLLDRLAQVPRELLDARVDGCSGFLVGGHGSSRWRW